MNQVVVKDFIEVTLKLDMLNWFINEQVILQEKEEGLVIPNKDHL